MNYITLSNTNKAVESWEEDSQLNQKIRELERQIQELRRLVTLDGLTQIANRHQFEHQLIQNWERSIGQETPLSLIMCNIDHFQLYNDIYGYLAGDRSLRRIAETLVKNVWQPGDLVARYRGETFAVILNNTPLIKARQVAERIRLSVENLHIPHQLPSGNHWITLSLGVATMIPQQKWEWEQQIALANCALSQAKEQGCNQVVSVSDLPQSCWQYDYEIINP